MDVPGALRTLADWESKRYPGLSIPAIRSVAANNTPERTPQRIKILCSEFGMDDDKSILISFYHDLVREMISISLTYSNFWVLFV